jgi:hypothetical protein
LKALAIVLLFFKYHLVDGIDETMGGAFGTHGRELKCVSNIGLKI